ncbi:MAG: acetoin utilization protein AcuC, partial [Chloroflexota bacterium]
GYAINVPLPPGTSDQAYLWAFDELVPALLRAFGPDLIVNQNGADAHQNDTLAHLRLSSHAYAHIAHSIHALAHDLCGGRWLALGGGGYDLYDAVPRAWALVFAEMVGAGLPPKLPESWRQLCQAKGGQPPTGLLEETTASDASERAEVAEIVQRVREASPLLYA